jgi:hypothetical protein
MYDCVKQISQTQNDLSTLVAEMSKRQESIHDMILEQACNKTEVVQTPTEPVLTKSFSQQLLKPRKK